MFSDPIIVVPGITATYLRDEYSLPAEVVWSVRKKEYDRIVLHPNDLRYEAREPAQVRPEKIFEIAYEELIEELRANLRGDRRDETVPVHPFGYDWRMPLDQTVRRLEDFVDEVIARTRLLRHYQDDYEGTVHLVGHSMGGLVIAGYLARKQTNVRKVNRVATLATPFQGSYESVLKITTGLGVVGTDDPKARDRWAARLTPGLYHLLPSFDDALEAPEGHPTTFFDREAWQPSVVRTLDAFVAETAVRPVRGSTLLSRMLRGAEKFVTESVFDLRLEEIGFDPDRWLCVVGVDQETRVRLAAEEDGDALRYILTSKDRMNRWNAKGSAPGEWVRTGDGTVPYRGAIPPFLDVSRIVCITPGDYGTWELQDRLLTEVGGGFHGILPNMNMLHRMLIAFFTPTKDGGRPPAPSHVWGRPAPDLEDRENAWDPPFRDGMRRKED